MLDPADPVAAAPPSRWAAAELSAALAGRGLQPRIVDSVAQATAADLCIVASGNQLGRAPSVPEALVLGPAKIEGRDVLLAIGHDSRGLVYALLDLADRVRNAPDPAAALATPATLAERPANTVRSVTRLFTSDVEDKPWFNDREMWPRYLAMLAAQRFNRFNLSFGIGYDFLRDVTDAYFLFAYPFLLAVPGYNVRAANLPDAERDRNLEMLRFISEQTVARGLEFQLGLWMHGYEWINSPHPNYTIEGLTAGNARPLLPRRARARCSRPARRSAASPSASTAKAASPKAATISGRRCSTAWQRCGRKVEIDMHAKGIDQAMIDTRRSPPACPSRSRPSSGPSTWACPITRPTSASWRCPKPGRKATRPDGAQHRLPQLHPLRLRATCCAKTAATTCCTASGRARSACSCGATR